MKNYIAHRGLKEKNSKENTIQAFQNAINNPHYIGFELDIRTSKDDVFTIIHNAFVGTHQIKHTYYRTLNKKYHLPRLEEVLKLDTNKIILIEIKEANINVKKFVRLISKYREKNIYVMSFHKSIIHKLKEEKIPCKLGVLNYVLNSETSYQDYDFICILESIMTPNLETYFYKKNIQVFLYGIHHLKQSEEKYKTCYFITDKIVL